ncbi:MAG: HNH endonuclease [Planctomycetota bacterium]|jgi:hypothetical protein
MARDGTYVDPLRGHPGAGCAGIQSPVAGLAWRGAVSRGGRRVWKNVVAACKPCNTRKGNRTPHEARMTPRTRPWVPTRKIVLRQHAVTLGVEKWMPYFAGTSGPLSRSSDLRA